MAMSGPRELIVLSTCHMEYWVLQEASSAWQTTMEYLMGPDDWGGRAGE